MPIMKAQAEHIARQRIASSPLAGQIVLLEDATIEFSRGWMFSWNSVEYARTGDPMVGLVGNSPFIVDRESGAVHPTGTSYTAEHYIEVYERDGHLDDA